VVATREQYAAGEPSIASGSASFLVVRLRSGGHGPVHNQPHSRLIDPHAEGAGGGDNFQILLQEPPQHFDSTRLVEAGVVRRSTKSRPIERPGETLGGISSRSVNDGQPVLLPQERKQPFEAFSLVPNRDHPEPEIGAVERAQVKIGAAKAEGSGDVLADFRSCAAGQGDDGRFSEGEAEPAQGTIGRTKIVSP